MPQHFKYNGEIIKSTDFSYILINRPMFSKLHHRFENAAATRYLKIPLDKDYMVYGVKIDFEDEGNLQLLKPKIEVVVNGTYNVTDDYKCGDGARSIWRQETRLLYPCGHAGKVVWLLINDPAQPARICSIQLYKGNNSVFLSATMKSVPLLSRRIL